MRETRIIERDVGAIEVHAFEALQDGAEGGKRIHMKVDEWGTGGTWIDGVLVDLVYRVDIVSQVGKGNKVKIYCWTE